MLLSNLFVVFGSLFALSIVFGKLFVFRLKDTIMVSNYIAIIAAFLGMYSIAGLLLVSQVHSIRLKLLMLVFASSPFLLGQMATYRTEKIFTVLQVLIALVSVIICLLYF